MENLSHRVDSFLASTPGDQFTDDLDKMHREIPRRRNRGTVPSKINLFVFQATPLLR